MRGRLRHQSTANRGRSTNARADEARERLRALQKKSTHGGAAEDDDASGTASLKETGRRGLPPSK